MYGFWFCAGFVFFFVLFCLFGVFFLCVFFFVFSCGFWYVCFCLSSGFYLWVCCCCGLVLGDFCFVVFVYWLFFVFFLLFLVVFVFCWCICCVCVVVLFCWLGFFLVCVLWLWGFWLWLRVVLLGLWLRGWLFFGVIWFFFWCVVFLGVVFCLLLWWGWCLFGGCCRLFVFSLLVVGGWFTFFLFVWCSGCLVSTVCGVGLVVCWWGVSCLSWVVGCDGALFTAFGCFVVLGVFVVLVGLAWWFVLLFGRVFLCGLLWLGLGFGFVGVWVLSTTRRESPPGIWILREGLLSVHPYTW